ncbi:MAG: hypothetical protein JW715_04825 [Sedimentisphaerales bacterium]|nr:hypothetical protein [Sedimentisphaerales bacterium]
MNNSSQLPKTAAKRKLLLIVSAITIIAASFCGCGKQEPQNEENTPAALEQTQAESAEETQAGNSIELAKWAEGKAGATTIATGLRAYAAENGTNGEYENIAIEKLGLTPGDLRGLFFNINNYELTDVSFDTTRTDHPLHYTITVTRPDDSWKIKSFQLLHTNQWIQTP